MKHAHVWRLVNRGYADYTDIVRHWDIMEVMTANEWLDIHDDQEWIQQQEAEAKRRAAAARRR